MREKKEKKKSFKDILRESFPVNMDGFLGESGGSGTLQEPTPSNQTITDPKPDVSRQTPPSEDTGLSPDTVPCWGTVPHRGTVASSATASSLATVPLLATAVSRATVPHDESVKPYHHDNDGPVIELISNYFLMDADVFDVLSSHQDPYERIVYGYLYRQSYGFNRQTCFVGLKSLVQGCQLSKNSVRRTLDRLEEKGHVQVIERINERDAKGTVYRVYLPCEIHGLNSQTTFKTHH